MFARRILTLSLLLAAISAYLMLFEDISGAAWGLGIGMLGTICSYIFQHQLDWWWYKRYPPRIPPEVDAMYAHAVPGYTLWEKADREKFRTRARLFVESKEFIAQGFKTISEDVKYMIAYYAILVSQYRDDYLYKPYDRIVLYLHPFLSPNHPDTVHTSETEHVDGTIILSLEQFTAGFLKPTEYYQTGLHVFAEIFLRKHPVAEPFADPDLVWQQLEDISGMSKERLEAFIGLPLETPDPVLIHHWFAFGQAMREKYPSLYGQIARHLGKR